MQNTAIPTDSSLEPEVLRRIGPRLDRSAIRDVKFDPKAQPNHARVLEVLTRGDPEKWPVNKMLQDATVASFPQTDYKKATVEETWSHAATTVIERVEKEKRQADKVDAQDVEQGNQHDDLPRALTDLELDSREDIRKALIEVLRALARDKISAEEAKAFLNIINEISEIDDQSREEALYKQDEFLRDQKAAQKLLTSMAVNLEERVTNKNTRELVPTYVAEKEQVTDDLIDEAISMFPNKGIFTKILLALAGTIVAIGEALINTIALNPSSPDGSDSMMSNSTMSSSEMPPEMSRTLEIILIMLPIMVGLFMVLAGFVTDSIVSTCRNRKKTDEADLRKFNKIIHRAHSRRDTIEVVVQ